MPITKKHPGVITLEKDIRILSRSTPGSFFISWQDLRWIKEGTKVRIGPIQTMTYHQRDRDVFEVLGLGKECLILADELEEDPWYLKDTKLTHRRYVETFENPTEPLSYQGKYSVELTAIAVRGVLPLLAPLSIPVRENQFQVSNGGVTQTGEDFCFFVNSKDNLVLSYMHVRTIRNGECQPLWINDHHR